MLGVLVVIGRPFSWEGLKFWLRIKSSCIFDKSTGRYSQHIGEYVIGRLDEIYALQLIREGMRSSDSGVGSSSKSSFISYELNLVLASGKRVPVIDHSARDQIQKDADTIVRFLDVPLWDNI